MGPRHLNHAPEIWFFSKGFGLAVPKSRDYSPHSVTDLPQTYWTFRMIFQRRGALRSQDLAPKQISKQTSKYPPLLCVFFRQNTEQIYIFFYTFNREAAETPTSPPSQPACCSLVSAPWLPCPAVRGGCNVLQRRANSWAPNPKMWNQQGEP